MMHCFSMTISLSLCVCVCVCLSTGSHLITAANFCMNGKLAVVGTYDGRCIFYETEVRVLMACACVGGRGEGGRVSGGMFLWIMDHIQWRLL